jgi:hypothetical protein
MGATKTKKKASAHKKNGQKSSWKAREGRERNQNYA